MSKPSNQRVAYHHLTDRVEMEKTATREKSDLKKASLTSVETVGALHFINQIQRVAERTAGYKGREKMEIVTDLDMKVISGDWDEDVSGPSQPLYSGTVKYKAKVYAVSTGLLGNPTLWEDSGTGKIFSDPGGGFYFKPQGRGVNTGNKGLDQIVRNSLDEAVYHNSGQITRAGSLHLAGWKKEASGNVGVMFRREELDTDNWDVIGSPTILLKGSYQTIRQALDAVLKKSKGKRKSWQTGTMVKTKEEVMSNEISESGGVAVEEILVLTYKGRPFPSDQLKRAYAYLRDGTIDFNAVVDGGSLRIPSKKGLIEIRPGNTKAWFRFTVLKDGKDISTFPSGWSTEDDSEMHSRGHWDVGRKPEALGVQQTLERHSLLKKDQIAKIESWAYSNDDFRGLKLASTKNAAKKRKALYVGVMLSPGDKKTLEAWWKKETGSDLLRKSYMHHMTIKFKPSPEDIAALSIGDPVPLKVVGWAADGQAQAVLVQPSGVRSTNSHPHVTVATDGTSPAYSNDLIKSGPVTKVSGPTLKGRIGIFTGKDVQYDLTDTIYEEE